MKNKGIYYIILSAFFFAVMNMFVKLAGDIPPLQKSFFRNLIAAFFALFIIIKNKEKIAYHKKDLPLLILRSTCGTIGILCNFYAVDHLLLSDASMLGKLAPFFVILFSSIFLKEKANLIQKIAIVVAFIGSLFIIKPSLDISLSSAAIIGVIGAMGAGAAYTCVRQLGKNGVAGPKIVFFFSCFSCLSVLPFIIINFTPMTPLQTVTLLCAGLSAAGGQFAVTAAYTNAPGKDISVFDYSQVIFAALLGFIFLNQVPDLYSFIGYFIICGVAITTYLFQMKKGLGN